MAKKTKSKSPKKATENAPKKQNKQLVSIQEFARQVGVKDTSVRYGIKKNRIPYKKVAGRVVIPLDEARRAWNSSRKGHRLNGATETTAPKKTDDTDDEELELSSDETYQRRNVAEMKRAEWLALKAELDVLESKGELVSAEKVKSQAFDMARRIRDHVLSIPDRLSAELCGITDQAEMHSRLTKELTVALTDLADGISKTIPVLRTE